MTDEQRKAAKWAVEVLDKLMHVTGITLTTQGRAHFETLRSMGKPK